VVPGSTCASSDVTDGRSQGGGRCQGEHALTLLQLTALRVRSAPAPVPLTGLVLGTRPLVSSAMVDRLTCTGLVCSASDPQERRRVQLTIAARAKPMSATSTQAPPDVCRRWSMV
jgi:hypothetical protein